MRRKRAFILTEIVTGLYLQCSIILITGAALYWLMSFYFMSAKILLGSSRVNNFMSYLEPRIKNCGLGLFNCQSSDKNLFRKAFNYEPNDNLQAPDLAGFESALVIFKDLNDFGYKHVAQEDEDGIIRGSVLGILYTTPLENVLIQTISGAAREIKAGESYEYYLHTASKLENFKGNNKDIRSWCVLPSVGVPFCAQQSKRASNNRDTLKITLAKKYGNALKIPPVSEVNEVRAEFFYINHELNGGVDFYSGVICQSPMYDDRRGKYNSPVPLEEGLLEIYFELCKSKRTLDIYILSYGGEHNFLATNTKPDNWPINANWDDDYLAYDLHVEKASLKLNNVIF